LTTGNKKESLWSGYKNGDLRVTRVESRYISESFDSILKMSKPTNVGSIEVDGGKPAAANAAAAAAAVDVSRPGNNEAEPPASGPSSPELERAYSVALRWIGPLFAATMAVGRWLVGVGVQADPRAFDD
jgi:hypothetical protein